jgi:hypothetical protein
VTEAEWLATTDPQPMLDFLRGRASERKLRLFACANCRSAWHLLEDDRSARHLFEDERSRAAVDATERYADGAATAKELDAAYRRYRRLVLRTVAQPTPERYKPALHALGTAASRLPRDLLVRVLPGVVGPASPDLLRDIFQPFRTVPAVDLALLAWNDGTVPRLARTAYENRDLPAGTLTPARLALLADALEDAGCADAVLLGHLRGPGPHVRGCWVVDLLLGKE